MCVCVLDPRPANLLALDHVELQRHVHRRLEAGADDLAVALQRVPVAEIEVARRRGRPAGRRSRPRGRRRRPCCRRSCRATGRPTPPRRPGATATRPSIGRSGSSMRLLAELGRSRMPTLRVRSSCQTKRRAGSGSFSMRVRLSPATALMPLGTTAETAVSRLGRSRTIFTTSVSSGVGAFDVERPDLAGPWPARPFVVVAGRREGVRLDDRRRA